MFMNVSVIHTTRRVSWPCHLRWYALDYANDNTTTIPLDVDELIYEENGTMNYKFYMKSDMRSITKVLIHCFMGMTEKACQLIFYYMN